MPKVLSKLRIDEISAVSRGAGENVRIVLMKRDDSDGRRGFYHKLFAAAPVRKAMIRGYQGHWVRNIHGLTREEATAYLLHDAHGRELLRDTGGNIDTAIIQKFASNNRLPNESAAQAFVRIFSEDSPQGLAIRKCWLLSKGQSIITDDDDDARNNNDDDDAMEELEALAAAERERKPSLTKAAAFSKVYAENPELAAKERLQNRPR
jgi:hypothetical protein